MILPGPRAICADFAGLRTGAVGRVAAAEHRLPELVACSHELGECRPPFDGPPSMAR